MKLRYFLKQFICDVKFDLPSRAWFGTLSSLFLRQRAKLKACRLIKPKKLTANSPKFILSGRNVSTNAYGSGQLIWGSHEKRSASQTLQCNHHLRLRPRRESSLHQRWNHPRGSLLLLSSLFYRKTALLRYGWPYWSLPQKIRKIWKEIKLFTPLSQPYPH